MHPEERQEIKKKRMKNYFLEAAIAAVKKEGADQLTVRKVADAAGYSYATIYNYFKDLNALLWETRQLMIQELVEAVKSKMSSPVKDKEDIKKVFKLYMGYFFEHPEVFRFFCFYPLIKPEVESTGGLGDQSRDPDFSSMWSETFGAFVQNGVLRPEDIEIVAKLMIYSVQGLLTLRFSSAGDMTENQAYQDLEKIVDHLL